MTRREFGLLLRQLTAHDAFVLRRAAREFAAAGLARLGTRLPSAARAALRIYPGSKQAHLALVQHADARGDTAVAARHQGAYEELAHNGLEISVLDALNTSLAWRRASTNPGGAPMDLHELVRSGRLEEARARLDASGVHLGSRVDGLLTIAAAAAESGDGARADSLLAEAVALDSGRADVWLEIGLRGSGGAERRSHALERAVALDPSRAEAWLAFAEYAGNRARASDARWRALELDPAADAALLNLEDASGGKPAERLALSVSGSPPGTLGKGQTLDLEVELQVDDGDAGLWILEPFGDGLACEPRGRIALETGRSRVHIRVTAQRPDAVNCGRPWRLHLALASGPRLERVHLDLTVPDREPGELHYVITEDHELYDEREFTDAETARITMVDKSRLAEQLANEKGAVWTHMVDVGSLNLLPWAAEQSSGTAWSQAARESHEHMVESVAAGNDLGLHCHGFHDPGTPVFCHGFDHESDRVTTPHEFLQMALPQRRFWSRAFPALGEAHEHGSRAWATWRGIGALEAVGRLGDPRFRVTMFRAGSFDFGEDADEQGRSLELLARLGMLSDSDVPKPRLYHRPMANSVYPVANDPRSASPDAVRTRTLEIRAEFNIEADFLSDVHVLNAYVDGRLAALRDADGVRPGVHTICAMTHDKFINMRMGRRWDSLEPDYGDWATIRGHLAHVGATHPEVRFSRVRDAVLAWWDRYTPRLLAWRDEEVVVLAKPGADSELYRYSLRLLGRDISVSADRRRIVEVLPPAWLHGRIRTTWIERDGERWPSRALPIDPAPLTFEVDTRDADWELVVEANPGDGIRAQPVAEGLRLTSAHDYRAATVELPSDLASDGIRRRLQRVRLDKQPNDEGYGTTLGAQA